MSLLRRNPRRDGNEKEIRQALEAVGAEVYPNSGKDRPDLLVLFQGRWTLMAVKMPNGRLTPGEKKRVPWTLVRSVEQALDAIGLPARAFQPGDQPWLP